MVSEDGVGVTGRPVGDAVIARVRGVDVQRGLRRPRAADRKLGPAYFVLQAGFVLFGSRSFTATMPNAWPDGNIVPHWGYEMSFPARTLACCAA
jgi:hypothetical protein